MRADAVPAGGARGSNVIPPVIVFGLTWLLGMLAVTVYLTRL
jgi:hypothetical protein